MFNRLIIVVLTLGLLITFSGVAFGTNDAPKQADHNLIAKTNPNAPKIADLKMVQHSIPMEHPGQDAIQLLSPATILPPNYYCDYIDYSGGAAAVYSMMPDADYPIDYYMCRIEPEDGYVCSVKAISIGVYAAATIGDPGMLMYLFDGARVKMDSVEISPAEVAAAGFGYVTGDFTGLNGGGDYVFTDGEIFYIGWAPTTDDGLDTLAFLAGDLDSDTDNYWSFALWGGYYGWTSERAYLGGVDLCCDRIPYSSCYDLEYDCNTAYFWTIPDAYGDDLFNQRFSVTCPETLSEVGVALYAPGTVGSPDLMIYGWYSDGAGFPDESAPIPGFPILVPNASIVYHPDYNVVAVPPIEMREDFHIGWSIVQNDPGDVLAGLSDDGSCGTMRSSENWNGFWGLMLDDWGADVNFLIYAHLCKDEFCTCRTINYLCNIAWYWRLPDRYGDIGDYQKFTPLGMGCRLETGRVALYDNGEPDIYTTNSAIQIWTSDPLNDGLPGTLIRADTLTPADYVMYPGLQTIDYTDEPGGGIIFDTDLWLGIEAFTDDTLLGIRTLSDDATCGSRRSCENWAGYFYYMVDDWGDDVNFYMEMDVCCVPVAERNCAVDDDWPTYGHDFGRSNASLSSLGADPQGNLTLAWIYEGPEFGNLNSPVIYKDTVVYCFLDELVALDINDGSLIWSYIFDGFVIGAGMYSTPTIFNFDDYGTFQTLVFNCGGDAKAFSAFDLASGAVVWTRTFLDHGGNFMTWGTSVIVDVGGVAYVVYNDDDGDIYMVNALTGAVFADWATAGNTNPMNYGGFVGHGVSAGGGLIYIGTDHNAANGNVLAIDPATGDVIWDLDPDQQLEFLDPDSWADPPAQPEAFTGAIAYDAPVNEAPTIYVVSEYSPESEANNSGGIVYSLDAGTGAINWAALGIGQDYCGVAVDGAHIINCGWAPWVPGYGVYRGPTAFVKENGSVKWANSTTNPGLGDFWLADGMLSCEVEKPDLWVGGTRNDFLGFYDSDWGHSMWHRRFVGGYSYAHHYAPAMDDGHLLYTYMSNVMCLTEQDPRPRLDIPLYVYPSVVQFGSLDHTVVRWENALGNRGGAPLTIDSVVLNDTDNGTIPPPSAALSIVDVDRVEAMDRMAAKFAGHSEMFRNNLSDEISISEIVNGAQSARNNAAFAIPSWVYLATLTPTPGTVIPAPGDYLNDSITIDITVEVNGPQVPRGEQVMYAHIYSDDPDYFLDSARGTSKAPHAVPMIQLSIVGGCLYDRVEMTFGVGGGNDAQIWNATKLASGDITSIHIDGDGASFWQGAFIFATAGSFTPPGKPGLFSTRVAHYADNWSAANPMEWQSIMADINCITGQCPPEHTTSVLLGTFSHDNGGSYDDVYGEVVTFAIIDSVQDMCDYDTLGNCLSWDWNYAESGVQPPYDDTLTWGFHACVTVIGALDEPDLNNFWIEKFDFDGRYGPVNDVYMGAMMDYDIGGLDHNVAGYDADISTAWAYECNTATNAWGLVKIPFNCNGTLTPMINAKTLTAGMAAWNDSSVWIDSAYYWMSSLTGLSHQPGTDPGICAADPDDRNAFFTIAELDIPGYPDRITIGVAVFGMPGMNDASDPAELAPLANMANMWCGFGRGDTDNDGDKDIFDIARTISAANGGDGAYPFDYLADVDNDDDVDYDDVNIMIDLVFNGVNNIVEGWEL